MTNLSGRDFIEAIKSAPENAIEAIIGHDYELRRRGDTYRGLAHDSLTVYAQTRSYVWYSKGDSHKGDVINWLENERGWSRSQAIEWLARRAGIERQMTTAQRQRLAAERQRRDALTVIAEYLAERLAADGEALAYARGRGWSGETIKAARVGYWDGDRAALIGHLRAREVDETAAIVAAALKLPARHLVYCHYEAGACVYLSSRTIESGDKKALREAGTIPHYNLVEELAGRRRPYFNHAWRPRADRAVIVEGQADAITLAQWEIAAVALAGIGGYEELAIRLADCEQLYIALDDEAAASQARQHVNRAIEDMAAALGARARVVTWPAHDANDWLQAGASAADCAELLAEAPRYARWLAEHVAAAPALEQEARQRLAFEAAARLDDYAIQLERPALAELLTGGRLRQFDAMLRAVRDELRPRLVAAELPRSDQLMEHAQLLGEPADHAGHANCLLALYPNKFCHVAQWGWLYYNGAFWEQTLAEARLGQAITQMLRQRQAAAVAAGRDALTKKTFADSWTINGVKAALAEHASVAADTAQFDADPDFLNVANGALNLRTGELMSHSADQYFSYCIAIPYEPAANDVVWLVCLAQWLAADGMDPAVVEALLEFVQMAVGYSITGHTSEECLFYLYGPTRSGKGSFTGTLQALMGSPLAAGVDFTTLTANRHEDTNNFDLARLKPSRILFASESGKYQRINAPKLKQMTAADPIVASFKRRDHFEFVPAFKIWLASNHPLNLDVDDDAAWARARVVHFPTSRLGAEDKGLKRRLQDPAVLAGVLAWAVEGARRWYGAPAGLMAPPIVAEHTQSMRDDQDLIKMWLEECAELAPGDDTVYEATSDLFKSYREFCDDSSAAAKHKRNFELGLTAKGLLARRADGSGGRERINGRQKRVRYGVRLLAEQPGDEQPGDELPARARQENLAL